MALTERIRLYEVLIRVREDGSAAAHQQKLSEVLRDGEVISATVLDPEAVEGDTLDALAAVVAGLAE